MAPRIPKPSVQRVKAEKISDFVSPPGSTLLFITADWSEQDRNSDPIVENIARRYAPHLRVGEVDFDGKQVVLERFGVTAVPTFLLFIDGSLIEMLCGDVTEARFDTLLGKHGFRSHARPATAPPTAQGGVPSGLEWLADILAGKAPTPIKSGAPSLADPRPMFVALREMVVRIEALRDDTVLAPLAVELERGVAFAQLATLQRQSSTREYAPAYLARIREIPSLIEECARLVLDPRQPVAIRFGVATSMMYSAIANNLIADDRGTGYGYLDEWLVLNVTYNELMGRPALNVDDQEAFARSHLVSSGLPQSQLLILQHALTSVANQAAVLRTYSPQVIQDELTKLLSSEVPAQWTPPIPAAAPQTFDRVVHSPDGWTKYSEGGSFYSSGGTSYLGFAGGGGVTMSGNDIVISR